MIEKLTREQISLLPFYQDKWQQVGLLTKKADHAKAESAVNELYLLAGVEPPKCTVWFDSPLQATLAIAFQSGSVESVGDTIWAEFEATARDTLAASVTEDVRSQTWNHIWTLVGDPVDRHIEDCIKRSVDEDLRREVSATILAQPVEIVWANLLEEIMDNLDGRYWRNILQSGFGHHGTSALHYYDYFRSVLGIDYGPWFAPLETLAKDCGWWWPFEGQLVLTEKPVRLELNTDGRLHSESSMAIEYQDGWGLYAWNGVRVPEDIILHPEELTVRRITKEILSASASQFRGRQGGPGMDVLTFERRISPVV